MPTNWELYSARVLAHGATRRDRHVSDERRTMSLQMPDAPFCYSCTINGVDARLNILDGDEASKKKFHTLPDTTESIDLGDIVFWMDTYWLVDEIDAKNEVTRWGRMRECNHLFRFQIPNDYTIYERYGVLDSGVYSTTLTTGKQITVPDAQYKVYLPYDNITKHLYIDQRFATEVSYDEHGNPFLIVYKFTAFDGVSESFGNGKLLVMKARSDLYDATHDSVEMMVCDYRVQGDGVFFDEGGWY